MLLAGRLLLLAMLISNSGRSLLAQDSNDAAELPPVPAENPTLGELEQLPSGPTRNEEFGTGREPTSYYSYATNAAGDSSNFPEGLSLADVVASLYQCYPEIVAAREEFRRTNGELVSSWGAFDTKLKGYSLNEPTGFYENSRHAIGLARQAWWGGYLSAGYRIGRGDFQPWYKERETNKSGEFKVGWIQPLLQGRAIDVNRVGVFRASLARQASQPIVQQAILDSARAASESYWKWVSAGNVLKAQRELLELAESRGKQFESGVAAGKFAEIDLILNQQLIAERRGKVLDSERKFQEAAFKLSLYLRDGSCQPMVAAEAWLPDQFPVTDRPRNGDLQQDLADALARRPEPRILQIEIRKVRLDQQLACNDLLPAFDLVTEVSQDVGVPASTKNDKGEFELVVGVQGTVPIQRRKARGKIQSTSAKIAQLRQKLFLQQNKIEAELKTAYNSLQLASQIVEQAELSLRAAFESLDRYRFAFERGKIDLIYLNLLETKANETEIKLIDAQGSWFTALGQMQAALGLDPLEQSLLVSELPLSQRPGPGRLPEQEQLDEQRFEEDWKIHESPESTQEQD